MGGDAPFSVLCVTIWENLGEYKCSTVLYLPVSKSVCQPATVQLYNPSLRAITPRPSLPPTPSQR